MQMLEPEISALSYKASMNYLVKGSSPQKELHLRYWKQKQIELLKIANEERFSFESMYCNGSI